MRPADSRCTNTLCSTPVLIDALGIEHRIAAALKERKRPASSCPNCASLIADWRSSCTCLSAAGT